MVYLVFSSFRYSTILNYFEKKKIALRFKRTFRCKREWRPLLLHLPLPDEKHLGKKINLISRSKTQHGMTQ